MTTRVLLDGLAFPEGPRWHDGRLWFSDMHDPAVIAVDMEGRAEVALRTDLPCSGLGWLPDGRMLVVSMDDRRVLRVDHDGSVAEHADLSGLAPYHCNDMVVDAAGRAYVGNFGYDANHGAPMRTTTMVRVDADGTASVAADGLTFPNGAVITPDGATLVVAETFAAQLTAFDIGAGGELTNRRVWASLDGRVPDGICLDAEGAIWVASPPTNEAVRVAEGGAVLDRVEADQGVYAVMLGGEDRRTLFLCTAGSFLAEECAARRDGRIETVQVAVAGAGLP